MKRLIAVIGVLSSVFFLGGCRPSISSDQDTICPGKPSIEETVRVLSLQRRNAQPIAASAECIFNYQDEKGKWKKQEVNPVTVRFIPHTQIIFRGSEFGEVGFGANKDEFWLRVKPDLDSYWWGTRQQAEKCRETMLINPYNVTEALGTVEVTNDWQLSYENGYDILTLLDDEKTLVKRVFVDACDYLVRRIEYYDKEGLLKASAELDDYSTGEEGIVIPSLIEITYYEFGIKEGSVVIRLKHIVPFVPNEKQLRLLFKRPKRDGFEHMLRLNDACEFIEE